MEFWLGGNHVVLIRDTRMTLKDTHIKNAKPADKPYKLADGEGLHLEVKNLLQYHTTWAWS